MSTVPCRSVEEVRVNVLIKRNAKRHGNRTGIVLHSSRALHSSRRLLRSTNDDCTQAARCELELTQQAQRVRAAKAYQMKLLQADA